MHVLPTHSTFSFLMTKAGLSFSVTIWSTSGWPIQGNKKGHDRGLGRLCFLKYSCLIFVFEASSGSNRKHGLWELWDPSLLVEVSYSPCTHLGSYWTPKHCGLTRVLCSWGIMNVVCKWAVRNSGQDVVHIWPLSASSFHSLPSNFRYSAQSQRQSYWEIQASGRRALKQVWLLWVWGPTWLHRSHALEASH